jgi:LigD, primase-polymerase domain
VRPDIVVQVAFIEWTVLGKLRHQRLLAVRIDKDAPDVTREQQWSTQHVWTSRIPDLHHPDVAFDLDPPRDHDAAVRAAAIGLRDLLEALTLPSWIIRLQSDRSESGCGTLLRRRASPARRHGSQPRRRALLARKHGLPQKLRGKP